MRGKSKIVAVYDVKKKEEEQTKIVCQNFETLNDSNCKLTIDGKSTKFTKTFSTTGKHTVVFEINDTSLQDYSEMFADCASLISFDGSEFNTGNIRNFSSFFSGCEKLETVEVGNFDVSDVENFSCMFSNCIALKEINVENWNVKHAKKFNYMFNECRSVTELKTGNWNTQEGVDFFSMFRGCSKITNFEVSNFNMKNCTSTGGMFASTKITGIDINGWDFTTLRKTDEMFMECKKLVRIDISNWNVSFLNSAKSMFYCCESLESVKIPKLASLKEKPKVEGMFQECPKLTNLSVLKTLVGNNDAF